MRPGREIDCTLAQDVFGHRVFVRKGILHEETPKGDRPLRQYTRDMNAAWEVASKLNVSLIPIEGGQWFALLGSRDGGWKSPADFITYLQSGQFANAGAAVAGTASLAICLAATRALEARKNPPAASLAVAETQNAVVQH